MTYEPLPEEIDIACKEHSGILDWHLLKEELKDKDRDRMRRALIKANRMRRSVVARQKKERSK